jgi:DNA-binding transcriptional regulator YdaS (Cro superfamily)
MAMTAADLADRVLSQSAPGRVSGAAARIAGSAIEEIEVSLPRALGGERDQVRAYVEAYRKLTGRVLDAVGGARPDLMVIDEQHRVVVAVEAKKRGRQPKTVPWVRAALEQEAMSVPFSDWVGTYGAGKGTAVAVVALLRATLPGVEPLASPRDRRLPSWPLDEQGVVRFYRAVVDELSDTETPLGHIASVLGLTQTELAKLFGVRRQALDQWVVRGVPAERQAKLATLGEIADLLAARLKGDRIPGVVRRPASAYGGRSILAATADGDEEAVLTELRDAFDWAAAA